MTISIYAQFHTSRETGIPKLATTHWGLPTRKVFHTYDVLQTVQPLRYLGFLFYTLRTREHSESDCGVKISSGVTTVVIFNWDVYKPHFTTSGGLTVFDIMQYISVGDDQPGDLICCECLPN
jgi:hypothetical protein